jgi:hypothetical protein
MSTESIFEAIQEPVDLNLRSVGENGLTTLFGGGIINPFGPTLNAVVLNGEMEVGATIPIVQLMLNPFSQSATKVGSATIGDTWNPHKDLPSFFNLQFGSCPTLLLPSTYFELDDAADFYGHFLTTFCDGRRVLENVRSFPGDPWNRVKQDVDGLGSLLESIRTGTASDNDSSPLTIAESLELSRNLLEPTNLKSELKAFLFAWNGSIKLQGGGAMGNTAMPIEAFIKWFSLLASSCNLPEM